MANLALNNNHSLTQYELEKFCFLNWFWESRLLNRKHYIVLTNISGGNLLTGGYF